MLDCYFIFPDEIIENTKNTNSPLDKQQTNTGFAAKPNQE